ncbi:MAG TPA: hypothetical protein DCS43_09715 [Verrucomicrobia bacterium]|nr:hypothetical protein [Verrucomicrobiota bacterium]
MDIVGGNATVDPPVAYSMPDALTDRSNRDSAERGGTLKRIGSEAGQDSYIASNREAGQSALESPDALISDQQEVQQKNCYCGHCAGCKAASAQRRQELAQPEDPVAKTDQESEENQGASDLSSDDEQVVRELLARDKEVRAHEQAHASAGARNVRFDYQSGPDGRQYAVGGSADIEISASSGDESAKIAQARKMRAAALAPAAPSTQDMAVAAKASRIEAEAMAEASEAQRTKNQTGAFGSYTRAADDNPTQLQFQDPFRFFMVA